ncbi:hypothetical protein HRM2_07290 [Desulforapulum autotrophicum HRM2]|uniref:Uncharacterized protein n=1 Tax=Desulforapulum autotrophicum (strain ATCC 43914 / DSM 3382 / VKM B-1955 / HRM2) TaxID=177437 RepID=C0QJJ0_DESAH|nr:hypothetical protein [Desulforapulum autotrophicum]ACN13843.1 hypothetical protein HRM2_07290 [Desulforapulum autotrophicum HRM2]
MKNKKQRKGTMISGLAWYRKSQWDKLLEVSEDSDKLEETFEEWLQGAEEFVKNFDTPGVVIKKIDIDVKELIIWCASKNISVNSASRSLYTAQKVKESH